MAIEIKEVYPDDYKSYAISGANERRYPSFDLGLDEGGKEPIAVLTLNADSEDQGVFVNETEKARSLSGSTFTAIPLADAQFDAMYVCYRKPHCGLQVDIGIAGVESGLAASFEYPTSVDSDGYPVPAGWMDLAEEDNTTLLAAGTGTYTVKHAIPTDWVEATIEGITGYWIKYMVNTAGYSTAPTIESILVVMPIPAKSIWVFDTIADACDIHLNSKLTAGSLVDGDAIPLKATTEWKDDKFEVYNFIVKDLAGTGTVYCKSKVGGNVGS